MELRGCGPGCIVLALGLVLSCCLLPYTVSSIYSIVGAVLQVEGIPNWLWGDLLGTITDPNGVLYMMFAEGPICCVGTLALLTLITGLVMLIASTGRRDEEFAEEEYEDYAPDQTYEAVEAYEEYEDYQDPDQTITYQM
jgi:hypothetical protein